MGWRKEICPFVTVGVGSNRFETPSRNGPLPEAIVARKPPVWNSANIWHENRYRREQSEEPQQWRTNHGPGGRFLRAPGNQN